MAEAQFKAAIGRLREALPAMRRSPIQSQIVDPKEQVYARFQPIFAPDNLPQLTEDEFRPFLYFENNHHWTGLHRQVNRLCTDMPALRGTLGRLLDESLPIELRIDRTVGVIKGLGKGIATAILHVAYPDKYGVWNSTSEGALVQLGIYPGFERGVSLGTRYARLNDLLLRFAQELSVNLWTLDALWWLVSQDEDSPTESPHADLMEIAPGSVGVTVVPGHQFALERHLHDFLIQNWERLPIGQEWVVYSEQGDDLAGYEYACPVGRIDILAKHRREPRWLVVELKRAHTCDSTVGQITRYIGWVRHHLAGEGEEVHGLILVRSDDDALQYAVSAVPNLSVQCYEVEFRLKPAPTLSRRSTEG